MNSSILITGGSGSVGRNIPYGTKISSKDCDLKDPAAVDRLFASHQFEKVINTSAAVGGLGRHLDPSSRYDLIYDNLMMAANIINSSRKYKVKKVLSFLSSCVFSDSCISPYTEKMIYDGVPSPVHEPYAHAKRLLSVLGQICWDEGLNFVSLLPVNLYGPHDQFNPSKSHFVAALILRAYEAAKWGKDYIVWGDGKAVRDLVYLPDMADITTWLLENYNDREPVIICEGKPVEIGYVAHLIAKEFNIEDKLIFDVSKPVGQEKRILSGDKLKSIYPYKFTPVEEGIKKTVKWFNENYPNIRL